MRESERQRKLQPQRRPSLPSQRDASEIEATSERAALSVDRRALLGGGVAAICLSAFGARRIFSHAAELPNPPGQFAGPEYRAATLAFQSAPTGTMPPDRAAWATCSERAATGSKGDLDIVLAIDTTGSMGGVIEDVKRNVAQLVATLRTGDGLVRLGIVAYRDRGDMYVVRSSPMTSLDATGTAALTAFIGELRAGGGGDWPEALDEALEAASAMDWRGDVPGSIIVIADAPAHPENQEKACSIAQAFSTNIPQGMVSLIDVGSGANEFMRRLPKRGGGRYVTYDGNILKSLFPAITGCTNA